MEQFPNISAAEEMLDISEPNRETVSEVVFVAPVGRFPNIDMANDETATIAMPFDASSVSSENIRIRRANAASNWEFVELDTRVEDDMARAETSSGGVFLVSSELNAGLIAGVVVAAFILLVIGIAIGGLVIYFVVRREKWRKAKQNVHKLKTKVTRSFAKQV